MDCSTFVKKCLKHKNQDISFLHIYPESADYKLACQRCLSVIKGKCFIFDLQEILSVESDILHYWPLSQSEKYFDEMIQILQILDTEEYQKQIFQKIKDLRTKFDDWISQIEEKLQEYSSYKIKQEFHLKYKQAAQIKQLKEYIKEELNQQDQLENIQQKFKLFIKQQIESNQIEHLLNYLKEIQQNQDINLNKLKQITESIEKIFQDQKLFKQAQDQSIKYNKELYEQQIQIESNKQELKQKIQQEQILKPQETQNLAQKIDILTSQCDTNLRSSNLFKENSEQLSQSFKQNEEDPKKQIERLLSFDDSSNSENSSYDDISDDEDILSNQN